MHPFAPPLPPNSACRACIAVILPIVCIRIGRGGDTPPHRGTFNTLSPPLRIYGIARAYVYNGASGNRKRKRQYKAAKRGKNARKHASRPTTQPQAQTPLKTAYTASAVQFTQTATPTHEKTYTLYNNHTKTSRLSGKHTKTQNCL